VKEYTYTAHSGPVTVLLSDEEARARGLLKAKPAKAAAEPVEAKQAAPPANKARTAADKRAEAVEQAFNKR
jgi:hypothetical protein